MIFWFRLNSIIMSIILLSIMIDSCFNIELVCFFVFYVLTTFFMICFMKEDFSMFPVYMIQLFSIGFLSIASNYLFVLLFTVCSFVLFSIWNVLDLITDFTLTEKIKNFMKSKKTKYKEHLEDKIYDLKVEISSINFSIMGVGFSFSWFDFTGSTGYIYSINRITKIEDIKQYFIAIKNGKNKEKLEFTKNSEKFKDLFYYYKDNENYKPPHFSSKKYFNKIDIIIDNLNTFKKCEEKYHKIKLEEQKQIEEKKEKQKRFYKNKLKNKQKELKKLQEEYKKLNELSFSY